LPTEYTEKGRKEGKVKSEKTKTYFSLRRRTRAKGRRALPTEYTEKGRKEGRRSRAKRTRAKGERAKGQGRKSGKSLGLRRKGGRVT